MRQRIIIGALLALLAVITLIAASPILSVIFASVIASALHCPLDEGSVHPCFYGGHDIGPTLYDLGVFGWLMLVTIPILFFAIVSWIGIAIVWVAHRRASQE